MVLSCSFNLLFVGEVIPQVAGGCHEQSRRHNTLHAHSCDSNRHWASSLQVSQIIATSPKGLRPLQYGSGGLECWFMFLAAEPETDAQRLLARCVMTGPPVPF